ncbi:MAG: hypothetical protein Q8Q09_09970 [Deltaproteobacteria bacterium]|nr:hypothetical protein [Deltaproteobacteria bacterium]
MSEPVVRHRWVFYWGAGAIVLSLFDAIVRLARVAWDARERGLMRPAMLVFTALWTLVIVYGEGYRAFAGILAPRMASRLLVLSRQPLGWRHVLAPAYALSLVTTPPRRLLSAWMMLLGVMSAILIVRKLPQPWRGSVDFGVVCALTYGTLAIVSACAKALRTGESVTDPELPLQAQEPTQ